MYKSGRGCGRRGNGNAKGGGVVFSRITGAFSRLFKRDRAKVKGETRCITYHKLELLRHYRIIGARVSFDRTNTRDLNRINTGSIMKLIIHSRFEMRNLQ
jgi:hypothetical protein